MSEILGTDAQYRVEQLEGELSPNDHYIIASIFKLGYPSRGNVPLDVLKESLEPHVDEQESDAILLGIRDQSTESLVGFAALNLVQDSPEKILDIEVIGVHGRVGGQGLGYGLLKHIIDLGKEHHAQYVQLADEVPELIPDRTTKKLVPNPAHKLFVERDFDGRVFIPSPRNGLLQLQLDDD